MKFTDLRTNALYATKNGRTLIVLDAATMYAARRRSGTYNGQSYSLRPTQARQASSSFAEKSIGVLVLRGVTVTATKKAANHPRLPDVLLALTAEEVVDTTAILTDLLGQEAASGLYVSVIAPRDIVSDYATFEREREAENAKRRAAQDAEREREAARAQRGEAAVKQMRGLVSGVPENDDVVTIRLGALEQLIALARKE